MKTLKKILIFLLLFSFTIILALYFLTKNQFSNYLTERIKLELLKNDIQAEIISPNINLASYQAKNINLTFRESDYSLSLTEFKIAPVLINLLKGGLILNFSARIFEGDITGNLELLKNKTFLINSTLKNLHLKEDANLKRFGVNSGIVNLELNNLNCDGRSCTKGDVNLSGSEITVGPLLTLGRINSINFVSKNKLDGEYLNILNFDLTSSHLTANLRDPGKINLHNPRDKENYFLVDFELKEDAAGNLSSYLPLISGGALNESVKRFSVGSINTGLDWNRLKVQER